MMSSPARKVTMSRRCATLLSSAVEKSRKMPRRARLLTSSVSMDRGHRLFLVGHFAKVLYTARHGDRATAVRVKFWGTRGSIAAPGPETVRYGGNTPCRSEEH